RIKKRLETRYIDKMTIEDQEAIQWVKAAQKERPAVSIGIVMDAGDLLERLLKDGIIPDILTDQTAAPDPVNRCIPHGMSLQQAAELRTQDPAAYRDRAVKSMARHVGLMLRHQREGAVSFDYGNNLRAFAIEGGEVNAFDFPGFTPEFIRPLF